MSVLFSYPNLRGFIAIVTYGRSGSTLLQRIVQTIPGSCIRGENNGAFNPLYRAHQRARRARFEFGSAPTKSRNPWFGAECIELDSYSRSLADTFIKHILNPPIDVRWVGFKEIRFSELGDNFDDALDFLHAYFPNVHIIFNTRNAEEVSQSAWHKNSPKEQVLSMVHQMDERFHNYARKHPETTFLANHQRTLTDYRYLKKFFDQCEEPFDPKNIKAILSEKLTH